MHDRRLVYRVALKAMFFIGILVLLSVLLNSFFVPSETESVKAKVLVSLDISGMQRGEIRKARLDNKDVAVLFRKHPIANNLKDLQEYPDNILNSKSRSRKEDYFVYFNYGDSGNCPLFYSKDTFKDICSSKLFDASGREKDNKEQGSKVEIPPHYFIDKKVYFGSWNRKK